MMKKLNELQFGNRVIAADIRRLYDIGEVIYDKEWLKRNKNIELYYMYRDLYLKKMDFERLVKSDLRYDITIMPPKMLGSEYVKTAGHYHPNVPFTTITYPELYEVLAGKAIYLLQKNDLSDIVLVNASAGDKIIIPPGYGHITINASNKLLKMSNYIARSFSSLYDPIRKMGGGAYFITKNGYIPNKLYGDKMPPLREIKAPDNDILKEFGLRKEEKIYPLVKKTEILGYLTKPQNYLNLFKTILV